MSRRDLTVPALTVPLVNDKLTKLAGVTQNLDDTGGLNASTISSGLVPLARGGTNVDLSAAGSATAFLAESALHVVSARSIVAADVPSLDASKITTGLLALARGGTNADLSATGGTSKFLKQATAGAAITVVQPATPDLSDVVNWTTFTPTMTAASGTWSAGSVTTAKYRIIGKTMSVQLLISLSTVSATPTDLRVAIPASKTANARMRGALSYNDNAAGWIDAAICEVASAGTDIHLYKAAFGGTNWSTATTATSVYFCISFEIQ